MWQGPGEIAARLPQICDSLTLSRRMFLPHPQRRFAMKISARNRLKGKIVEVTKGQTTAHVRIDVNGAIVTASITNEAVDELRLAVGQAAYAVVKASDV